MDEDLLDYTSPADEETDTDQVPPPVQQPIQAPPVPPTVTAAAPIGAQPVVAPSAPGAPAMIPVVTSRLDPTTGQRVSQVQYFDAKAQQQNRERQAIDDQWRTMRDKFGALPIDQAENAVAVALRFQGQRQYQRDLQSGMNPGEALARSAPLIFGRPNQGTLGQAGTFIHATNPRFIDVGGVLYRQNNDGTVTRMSDEKPVAPKFTVAGGAIFRQNQDGTVTQVSEPKPAIPKLNQLDVMDYRDLRKEIDQDRKDLDALPVSERGDAARRLRAKIQRLDEMKRSLLSPGASPTAPRTGRVRVRAPNGKTGSIPANQLEAAQRAGYSLVDGNR